MKAELITAALVLAVFAFVLYKSDYLGGPDSLPDAVAFFAVAAAFAVRIWLTDRIPHR